MFVFVCQRDDALEIDFGGQVVGGTTLIHRIMDGDQQLAAEQVKAHIELPAAAGSIRGGVYAFIYMLAGESEVLGAWGYTSNTSERFHVLAWATEPTGHRLRLTSAHAS